MSEPIFERVATLRWQEDITLKNAEAFRLKMKEWLEVEQAALLLDLSDVAYLNSVALSIIADSVIQARRKQKELVIAGIQPTIQELFAIVKFDTFIKLFPEKLQAYTYFDQKQ